MTKNSIVFIGYFMGIAIGVICGIHFERAYPSKKNQKLGYEIACLDGQIAVIDMTQGKPFKTCTQIWEEKEDQ